MAKRLGMSILQLNMQLTYRQYLVGKIVECLYYYKDRDGVRKYVDFCEKNLHRQCIHRPVLEIVEEHLSSAVREELTELLENSERLFTEVMTDAVILLYETCNKSRFNRLIEREYAKFKII